jgi:hypothetical protein
MRRRDFIALLVAGAAACPLAAVTQQRTRMRRVGVFIDLAADDPESPHRIVAFTQRLAELGWSEGRNVQFEFRFGAGDAARFRSAAAELVALAPDIILAHGGPMTGLLQQATRTTPIVFVNASDPVAAGYVESLARPGGNITGFSQREFGFAAKWLELLKQISPNACGWQGLTAATALLVVEIADTSLGYDLGRKADVYASFGIAELWVINAVELETRIHRLPTEPGYRWTDDLSAKERLVPQSVPALAVVLGELELH